MPRCYLALQAELRVHVLRVDVAQHAPHHVEQGA
jgi:hypothetical protein